MLNRLTIGERLVVWGYQGDTQCFFCKNGFESRDHLFFQCSFSSCIWRTCMRHCSILNPSLDGHDVIDEGCSKWKTKKVVGVLCRLILIFVVYHIWRARNEIKFHGRPKMKEQILRAIFWEVRFRILGKGKFKKNKENEALCAVWNIDSSIMV
jgi:hypothetical protein